jgi:hypothetical protein
MNEIDSASSLSFIWFPRNQNSHYWLNLPLQARTNSCCGWNQSEYAHGARLTAATQWKRVKDQILVWMGLLRSLVFVFFLGRMLPS